MKRKKEENREKKMYISIGLTIKSTKRRKYFMGEREKIYLE